MHNVKHGDIVIVGTDGLWDNMYRHEIVHCVKGYTTGENYMFKDPQLVAEAIATKAFKYSQEDKWYVSPFGKSAREHHYEYLGGKPDDITVIVA